MTTYAKSQHAAPFDWNAALDMAIETDPDTREHYRLYEQSSNWVTCACGNQCDVIPRHPNGTPVDERLLRLGRQFCDFIDSGNWPAAKLTLAQIEARADEIIRGMK